MDTPLTIAIINLFRGGNVVTISQLTAQLVREPAFRLDGTMIEPTGDDGFRFVLSRPTSAP